MNAPSAEALSLVLLGFVAGLLLCFFADVAHDDRLPVTGWRLEVTERLGRIERKCLPR